jgi:transcriptional regulator with XRE-family HTH domain
MAKIVSNEEDKELSSVIRKLLSEKGLTVGSLAEFTGVKTSTIRNWIQRNKFPREHLKKIAQEIGLEGDIEEIKSKYKFDWLDSARNNIDDETFRDLVESVRLSKISFSESVHRFFSKLGKNDEFYYMSLTMIPFEMDCDICPPETREFLFETIAEASLEGASFNYIFPNKLIHEQVPNLMNYSFRVWETSFKMLHKSVVSYQRHKKKELEVPALHNVNVYWSNSPYLPPFGKVVLFKIADREVDNEFEYFAFLYSNTDTKNHPHSPLRAREIEQIREFVEEGLEKTLEEDLIS